MSGPNKAASTVVLQHDRCADGPTSVLGFYGILSNDFDGLAALRLKIIEGPLFGMPSLIEAFER